MDVTLLNEQICTKPCLDKLLLHCLRNDVVRTNADGEVIGVEHLGGQVLDVLI